MPFWMPCTLYARAVALPDTLTLPNAEPKTFAKKPGEGRVTLTLIVSIS